MNAHIPTQLDQLSKSELLKVAEIMHEENVNLVREVEDLKKLNEQLEQVLNWYTG